MSAEVSKLTRSSLEVNKVTPADALDLLKVLNEAQAYKLAHGDRGWLERFTLDDIFAIIERDDTYLGRIQDAPAVTSRLTWEDPRIWGPHAGVDGRAGYIHRLGSADDFRGQGVGRQMVEWACRQIADEGFDFARLDCNRNLMGYYSRLGFAAIGVSPFTDYPTVLHQRELGNGFNAGLSLEIELELFDAGRSALEDALV